MAPLKWTALNPVQFVKFYDPLNPNTSFAVPQLNPQSENIQTGDVRKYTQTVNGTAVIIGKREYPPQEITLIWNQIDISDLQNLAALANTSPLVYVDSNDNGYLGVLQIESCAQLAGMTSNVWTAKVNFLCLGPFDGQHTSLPQVTVPTLSYAEGTNGSGSIPTATDIYFWLTVQSKWGESMVGSVLHATTTHANSSIAVSWNEPTSNYYLFSRLYWYTANNSSLATFLTEYQKGFSIAGIDTFTVYGPYVQYSLVNPPTYSTAYKGYFAGGVFKGDNT